MLRSEHAKAMSEAGWHLWRVAKADRLTSYMCKVQGCTAARILSDADIERGVVCGPCSEEHSSGWSGRVIASHMDLVAQLRKKRVRLGLSQDDVEAASGLATDHVAKLEIRSRLPQFPTYLAWAETLGYDIVLVDKELPDQVLAIIEQKAGRPARGRQPPASLLMPGASGAGGFLSALEEI